MIKGRGRAMRTADDWVVLALVSLLGIGLLVLTIYVGYQIAVSGVVP